MGEHIRCPRCSSDAIGKYGHNPTGERRYVCKECSRTFTENPRKRSEQGSIGEHIRCPRCSSAAIGRNGYNPNGERRYVCKECRRTFIENPRKKGEQARVGDKRSVGEHIRCPRCSSDIIGRYGHQPNGERKYICKECKRTFIENPRKKRGESGIVKESKKKKRTRLIAAINGSVILSNTHDAETIADSLLKLFVISPRPQQPE